MALPSDVPPPREGNSEKENTCHQTAEETEKASLPVPGETTCLRKRIEQKRLGTLHKEGNLSAMGNVSPTKLLPETNVHLTDFKTAPASVSTVGGDGDGKCKTCNDARNVKKRPIESECLLMPGTSSTADRNGSCLNGLNKSLHALDFTLANRCSCTSRTTSRSSRPRSISLSRLEQKLDADMPVISDRNSESSVGNKRKCHYFYGTGTPTKRSKPGIIKEEGLRVSSDNISSSITTSHVGISSTYESNHVETNKSSTLSGVEEEITFQFNLDENAKNKNDKNDEADHPNSKNLLDKSRECIKEENNLIGCGTSLNLPEQNPFCAAMYDIPEIPILCEMYNLSLNQSQYEKCMSRRNKIIREGDNQIDVHIRWQVDEEFEIHALKMSHTNTDGQTYYLVEWEGWSEEYNSWEPEDSVQTCTELLSSYNMWWKTLTPDEKAVNRKKAKQAYCEYVRRKKSTMPKKCKPDPLQEALTSDGTVKVKGTRGRGSKVDVNNPMYRETRREQEAALAEYESLLNSVCSDPASLRVENNVDLEGPPTDFTYINDYMYGHGVTVPEESDVHCVCNDCYLERDSCCAARLASPSGYTKSGKVSLQPHSFIVECNNKCACRALGSCKNSVVQNGRKVQLTIYKTQNKGWGIKSKLRIPRGTFICSYVGEIITHEEAESRGHMYDPVGRTYLLDLEFCTFLTYDLPLTVDAATYGNVSHFINHSCQPNLDIYGVFTSTTHLQFPRMALFANRDIKKGEELTFDYQMTGAISRSQEEMIDQFEEPSCEMNVITLSEFEVDESLDTLNNNHATKHENMNTSMQNTPAEKVEVKTPRHDVSGMEDSTKKKNTQNKHMRCHCGAKLCRKWLY